MKRFDRVRFAEVLDMSAYVYCKRDAPKLRPKTLDIDATSRLVGGRRNVSHHSLQSTTYVRLVMSVGPSVTTRSTTYVRLVMSDRPSVTIHCVDTDVG